MTTRIFPSPIILIVDDEPEILASEALALRMNGYESVFTCADPRQALALVQQHPDCLILLDVNMPHLSGMELLVSIVEKYPEATPLMLTGHNDVETAVECIRKGAFDYLVKPVDQNRLITSVTRALEFRRGRLEADRLGRGLLEDSLSRPECFSHIMTRDRRLGNIFKYIEAVAPTGLPVLLTGETGTGKELFAQALHAASGRPGEFVCVNSAGIDDNLFSDMLFGHVAGAYTGANRDRNGLIDRARNGTLFLDEIGDMRPETQVKLLRLLQEGTYYRVGRETEDRTDARIIAATNRPLEDLKNDPHFRKDLFYRLKSHHVAIPPLRERLGDVPLLTAHFLRHAAEEQGKPVPTAPPELAVILSNYPFPGNVRELRGMIYDAVSRHGGRVLSCASIKEAVGLGAGAVISVPTDKSGGPQDIVFPLPLPSAQQVESALIKEALRRTDGNKSMAAEMIGMARQTFRTKLKDLGTGG